MAAPTALTQIVNTERGCLLIGNTRGARFLPARHTRTQALQPIGSLTARPR